MTQRGNVLPLILGLIALGALVAVAVVLLTAEPKETVNANVADTTNINASDNENVNATNSSPTPVGWKTYTDPESGIMNVYPSDWIAVQPSYATVGFREANLIPGDQDFSRIYITYLRNPQHLSLQDFYTKTQGHGDYFNRSSNRHESRMVGSHEALYFPLLPSALPNDGLVFSLGDYVVEVETHLDAYGNSPYEEEFFSIAESIR